MESMPTPAATSATPEKLKFTGYQKFVVAALAFLQFTIILDFMILSPLGAILMPALNITTAQFGWVVSCYAFSAGVSGILAAGFADRFDRKKMLLFFYTGFLLGTLFCGLAPDYPSLLIARTVTGLFGGVMGSIVFAISTDLFPYEMRGRVMGLLQTAFAASQVLGIPFSLYLSNSLGWHAPFILIVAFGAVVGLILLWKLRPINGHLAYKAERSPLRHLIHTLTQPRYLQGFAATCLLATGGFMLMPFGSNFHVHNLGVSLDMLPAIYMATGIASLILGPLSGKLSDTYGKYRMFVVGTVVTALACYVYTRMGISPLWAVVGINILMFVGVTARIISSSALASALPLAPDRGAYMAISSSLQQVSGGIAAAVAGLIVVQKNDGPLEHFDTLGDIVIVSAVISAVLMYGIHRYLKNLKAAQS
ncbi:MAG: MFS transporter [Bdellovibrionaceae bacterium]|nr:MFS transporter [Pseudobdellovibrionaceae bacterium]